MFGPSLILHVSPEISAVVIHSLERRQVRLREVNLVPKVIQLLSSLSSSLGKFDSAAGAFHYNNMLPSGCM